MSDKNLPYYYDSQIKRYLLQFMAVFAGLQVKIHVGTKNEKFIDVPIFYGSVDRVVAAILAENTQNSAVRLPLMSAHLESIELASDLRKGIGVEGSKTVTPLGGNIPDDSVTFYYQQAVPYRIGTEVAIFASNQDQLTQILEQLLLLFNPSLVLQTSDSPFDPTRISTIELTGVRYEENYPAGTEPRLLSTSLDFTIPIYLIPPLDVRKEIISKIITRVIAVSSFEDIDSSFEVSDPITLIDFEQYRNKIFKNNN